MAAIRAAMEEARVDESEIDELYFHENTIISPDGISVRIWVFRVGDDGVVRVGAADYFEI